MNRKHQILLILALFLLLPVSAQSLGLGGELETFIAKDMDGKTIDLSAVIGNKPIMLIFWASWCPNCKKEAPKINALVEKYRGQGMEFIGINVGYNDSEGKARRFMDKTGTLYPVIFDKKGSIPRRYGVQGVPTILVADKNGVIVFKNFVVPEITDNDFHLLIQ